MMRDYKVTRQPTDWKKVFLFVFETIVGFAVLIGIAALAFFYFTGASIKNRLPKWVPTPACESYTISKIGGCNGAGWCGVELEDARFDSSFHVLEFPVVGKRIEHCEGERW